MSPLLRVFSVLFFLTTGFAHSFEPQTICGSVDDRKPSSEKPVAKLVGNLSKKSGCTGTLIGKRCMLSSGHCKNSLQYALFDLNENHQAHPRNIYKVDQSSIVSKNRGQGRDYAVFVLQPNEVSGLFAGEVQGHYRVRYLDVGDGEWIRVTGHGSSKIPEASYSQQTHTGTVLFSEGTKLFHSVDTTNGNSGSAIRNEESGEIIGVHTHGFCREDGGENVGTKIANNSELIRAIETCLASEP